MAIEVLVPYCEPCQQSYTAAELARDAAGQAVCKACGQACAWKRLLIPGRYPAATPVGFTDFYNPGGVPHGA